MRKVIQFIKKHGLRHTLIWILSLRTEAKNDFEKHFFKLMDNAVFGKTMENIRKHRDIKLIRTNRIICLVSETNCHTTKRFPKDLLATEMKKIKLKMNKPVHLGLSILAISATIMHEVSYYINRKYQHNTKLCYMDRDQLYHLY